MEEERNVYVTEPDAPETEVVTAPSLESIQLASVVERPSTDITQQLSTATVCELISSSPSPSVTVKLTLVVSPGIAPAMQAAQKNPVEALRG